MGLYVSTAQKSHSNNVILRAINDQIRKTNTFEWSEQKAKHFLLHNFQVVFLLSFLIRSDCARESGLLFMLPIRMCSFCLFHRFSAFRIQVCWETIFDNTKKNMEPCHIACIIWNIFDNININSVITFELFATAKLLCRHCVK